jgi:hypothetical protein
MKNIGGKLTCWTPYHDGADCGNDNGRDDDVSDEHCDGTGVEYKNNDGDNNDGDLDEDDDIAGDEAKSTINNGKTTTMATMNRTVAATMTATTMAT